MRQLFAIVVMALAATAAAHADPAIPAAQKAKLDKIGPIQTPVVYLAPAGKAPARWMVFIGPAGGAAISAWMITPGDKTDVARVDAWPNATKILAAAQTPQTVILHVESMEAPEIGQPAGLHALLPIAIAPDPAATTNAAAALDALPFVRDAKDLTEATARLATVEQLRADDTADKVFADDTKVSKQLVAARKSDKLLAKLIPKAGIPVFEQWQSLYASPTAIIAKLDKADATKALRAALAGDLYCTGHVCGNLVVGAEGGKLVIRALAIAPPARIAATPRHAVTANAKDTQTLATAAMIQTAGKFRGEAPSGTSGTVGVVDQTVIVRHGGFVATSDLWEEGGDVRFGDFDGDGLTDVVSFKTSAQFVLSHGGYSYGGDFTAYLEMTTIGAASADAAVAATLAVADDPLKVKDACGVLAKVTSVKSLATVLAPGGMVFGYEEPSQPARGQAMKLEGKDAVAALKAKKCPIAACSDRLPVCASVNDGPSTDYYMFTRVKGVLMLLRAAVYRGG